MIRAILFDLDGTLVDTRDASWALFSETNRAFALGIDSREAFFRAFEGNFFDSFARLVPDAQRAEAAKAHFMALLRTRYDPAPIDGMVAVVEALAERCILAVISTNTLPAIERIVAGASIAGCFSYLFSGDQEPHKSVSMRRFLADPRYAERRRCALPFADAPPPGGPGFDGREVVLVTDTVGDVLEAREAGVRAVGVGWGMHTPSQLLEAGAERVASRPGELLDWVLAEVDMRP